MVDIARMGSFFAGGEVVERSGHPVEVRDLGPTLTGFKYDPNGTYLVNRCYVQYFIPARQTGLPVVLIHGGALTGAMWETTPDGRKGWVELLLEAGRPVYVIDGVERGRAGFIPFGDIWPDDPLLRSGEEAWMLYRMGDPSGFPTRTGFDGQRFPLDHIDTLMSHTVPRWVSTVEPAHEAYRAALRRIGECVIFAHSSGGVFGLSLAQSAPDLVRAVVGIEPSTFPVGGRYREDMPFLVVMGDFLDDLPFWRDALPKFRTAMEEAGRAGARLRYHELADHGLPGHSHMYMMDHGNDLVLARILTLLDAEMENHVDA